MVVGVADRIVTIHFVVTDDIDDYTDYDEKQRHACRWSGKASRRVVMYNFGSPRVGNAKFVETYNKLVVDSWRIFNKNDIVSSVPRLCNYMHVNNSVAVSEEGKLEVYGG